jgi:SOS-response transcriptional repressor LexA/transcriptional regulator with XRE-family HTH domain
MTVRGYKDLLEYYIRGSGLSHREISRRCKDRGTSVSQAYISQLAKGDVPPPSEEVSRVLAEVTGGDADKLLMAAYMEKAPDEVKDILKKSENIDQLLKKIFQFYSKFLLNEGHLKNAGKDIYPDFEDEKGRTELLLGANPLFYFDNLTIDQKLEMLDIINSDAKEKNLQLSDLLVQYNIQDYGANKFERPSHSFEKIPVLGTVTAGAPIERDEYIEGYEMVETGALRGRDSFILRVKGDSMIGDHIFDGDRVVVILQADITPSDIAVVAVNGDEGTLKRVKIQNNMCVLLPSNPSMEPMLFPANEVHIIGKVIEVRHSLE